MHLKSAASKPASAFVALARKLIPVFFSAFVLAGNTSCNKEVTINAADYGLKEGMDNTLALTRALKACIDKNASKLIIPEGTYDIYPDKADQRYLNIANNDDGMKRIVFNLDGMNDFEIDGGGARFICHDHMVPFSVEGCNNIILRNFSVDWDRPFYLQGQVLSVDKSDNSFDMRILDECNWEIQGYNLRFSNKRDATSDNWYFMAPPMQNDAIWYQDMYWNIWYDPRTKAPAYCNELTTRVMEWNFKLDRPYRVTDLGDNIVRIKDACEELPQPGWVLVSVGVLSKNRLSPAIRLSHSSDITIEDVTVHHASGMALVAERCENVTLNRYNVLLPENSERMVTSGADATHFVGCKGLITLQDCTFENMLDDGTNVHGVYAEVGDVIDRYTLGMTLGHSQHQGFDFAQPGEKVALVDRSSLRRYDTLTVRNVRKINDYYFELSFREDISGRVGCSSVAENISCQPDLIMTGCEVRQNRARGILVSTAGKVLVEGNRFIKCTYAGIQTAGDANYWFESGPVTDFTIRNNLFEGQGLAVGNAPVLAINPEVGDSSDSTWCYHHNITFENNTVNAFSRIIVDARSIGNFIFRDNTINRDPAYPQASAESPAFRFTNCHGVSVENNVYNWGKETAIEASGTTGLRSVGNKGITNNQ